MKRSEIALLRELVQRYPLWHILDILAELLRLRAEECERMYGKGFLCTKYTIEAHAVADLAKRMIIQ